LNVTLYSLLNKKYSRLALKFINPKQDIQVTFMAVERLENKNLTKRSVNIQTCHRLDVLYDDAFWGLE